MENRHYAKLMLLDKIYTSNRISKPDASEVTNVVQL